MAHKYSAEMLPSAPKLKKAATYLQKKYVYYIGFIQARVIVPVVELDISELRIHIK